MTTHFSYSALGDQPGVDSNHSSPDRHTSQTATLPTKPTHREQRASEPDQKAHRGSSTASKAPLEPAESHSQYAHIPQFQPSLALLDLTEFSPPSESKEANFQDGTKKAKRLDWARSWLWEIGGAIFSVICIVLLIGFLKYVDGKLYDDWEYRVSPNAVASVIVTIAKAAMLIPVSACLSQLKWNQSQHPNPTPLYHMQILDQASRGPWGSLEIFWRLRPGLATVGAVLMILSVAIDPFAQQILSFPSNRLLAPNETAYTQTTHQYWPRWATSVLNNVQNELSVSEVEPRMQVAIFSGLSQTNNRLEPICSSGSCDYDDFITLGICSECEDVTAKATQTCVPSAPRSNGNIGDEWASTPTNCTYTAPSGFNLTPGIMWNTMDTSKVVKWISMPRQPWTSIITSDTSDDGTPKPIVSFFAAKYEQDLIYYHHNITVPEQKPTMTECSVYWCERQYTQNYFSTGHRFLETKTSQNLYVQAQVQSKVDFWTRWLSPFNGSKTLSENSTYIISSTTWIPMRRMMIKLFNGTLIVNEEGDDADDAKSFSGIQSSLILYNSNNLTQSMVEMATSMTDNIRSGNMASRVNGRAYLNSTLIHVRWPWIILPAASVVLSIVLLMATAVSSRRLHTILWKSSVLPLLVSQLENLPGHDLSRAGDVDEMLDMSRKIKVVMASQDPPVLVEH